MSEVLTRAQRYLQPADSSFWRWSEDGSAAEWIDGPTIAIREEVVALLEQLASKGLPSLDSLLLLLAVCRESWSTDPSRLEVLKDVLTRNPRRKSLTAPLETMLNAIPVMPPVVQKSVAVKAELAGIVLDEPSLRTSPQIARDILDELKSGCLQETIGGSTDIIKPAGQWAAELRALCQGLNRLRTSSLMLRLATGLDDLPAAAPIELDEFKPLRPAGFAELLTEMEQDADLKGLARLTRTLMGIVSIPRPVGEQEELPLGGVSDIANRGRLDQLLLSELAHDDDVLITRIALREALYLRREMPPDRPTRERVLLLDSGLRMWGLPRIFATGVALAFAAMSKTRVRVYRAAGEEIVPVDLSSKQGLSTHLEALDPAMHPGQALPEFQQQNQLDETDVILVTHLDSLGDAEFLRCLDESELSPLYCVGVNRHGQMRVVQRSRLGERLLRETVLDLKDLLPTVPHVPPLYDPEADSKLPAILRLKRFPLRMPHAYDGKNFVSLRSGTDKPKRLLTISHDGRLMYWDRPDYGARMLSDRIPKGNLISFEQDDEVVRMVVGSLGTGRLWLIWADLQKLECRVVPLENAQHQTDDVVLHAGSILVIRKDAVDLCHATDGRLRNRLQISGRKRLSERFFIGPDGLFALSHDGVSGRFECLLKHNQIPKDRKILHAFDSAYCNSPVVVFDDGSLQIPPAAVQHVNHGHQGSRFTFGRLARDGSEFCLRASGELKFFTISLRIMSSIGGYQFTEDKTRQIPSIRQLRVRFSTLSIIDSQLVLLSSRGQSLRLIHNPIRNELELREFDPKTGNCTLSKGFPEAHHGQGVGYRLHAIHWKDGSQAVLDSRGMLHLKSSDAAIPEFTLVLHEDCVAGWSALGQVWGERYFHLDEKERTAPKVIWQDLIEPFVRRLR
ncbi:hypothetical protein [Planctomicrobium piriforme]|uniref:Uncharacterized protein n=1 Tax=Planctomicrobium piriforme TaxID=1576369 RepID=A0A1I3E1R9_9PLAN|nr:hypothetical protein [Planctomicrobium piriforme]SFH92940.1 hypothetical protein SAMN05421753_10444 [Planctomicrobium piriforme]